MDRATYALAGTVLGAALSLFGSYLTNEQQADLDARATKREAFAAFISEYTEYSRHLRDIGSAYRQGDRVRVQSEWAAALAQSPDLATARAVVALVGDRRTSDESLSLTTALFAVTAGDWREMTDQQIGDAIDDGAKAITIAAFLDAAKADLADE